MGKGTNKFVFFISMLSFILLCTQILPTCVVAAETKRVYSLSICAWDDGNSGYEAIYDRFLNNKTSGYVNNKSQNHVYSYRPGKSNSSKEKFNTVLDNAFGKSTSTDLNLLFFTGHCLTSEGKPVGIVLSYRNGKYEYYSWLELAIKLAQYKGRFLILLETCHAQYFIKEGIKNLLPEVQKRMDVIVSCGYKETSGAGATGGSLLTPPILVQNGYRYGKFAYALINGLGFWNGKVAADTNNNSDVTVKELYDYTRKKVKDIRFEMTVKMFSLNSVRTVISYPVKLSASKTSIKKGNKKTLKATAGGFAVKPKWKSSNTAIISVTNGIITAKKMGTAVITATYHGKKATCKVTVTVPVTKVALNKTSASITKGKTLTLKASVSPSNATKKTVTWTSSNSKVATVSSKGVVKGIAKGTATITAKATDGSGKKATCKVTVKNNASSSSITDFSKVLNKKPADAAKAIGFTKVTKQTYITYCTKPGKKYGPGYTYFWYYNECKDWKGGWNIIVVDNTISLYGVKKGAKISTLHNKLINNGWIRHYGSGTSGDNSWNYSRKGREYSESLNIYHYNGIIYKFEFEGALLD